MDAGESDKEVSDCGEIDSDNEEEHSSSEDSEEESDDDENQDGIEASSDEDGDEEEEESMSDDDDDGTEAASTVTGDEVGAMDDDDSDDEEALDKEDMSISKLEDPDMSCPICLNDFLGQDLGSPENCSHCFCLECIVEWSRNVNTCPIDRIEFHLIYVKQEINGNILKKIKVQMKKEEEEYVEEVTLCEVCRLGDREDRLLLCDSCDSGYHCECLDPPLETIPIEEWFCPPCARVINRRAGSSHSSHSRLIARTSASEIVRSRIQNHRTVNSEDSGPETVQEPRNVRAPSRTPKPRRRTKRKTKRKTVRKRKTTKARTKATAAGKSKAAKKDTTKTPTKRRRKTRRRKTRKSKKKSRRSWLASMKLVAPSVKKRIADRLGLCKPPPGHMMPYVKKSGGQYSTFVEQVPSLDMFGCHDQLLDFGASYIDDSVKNPRPCTSKQKTQTSSLRKKPIAVASASGINLLDNILETQNVLLKCSKDITIGKDGSLNVKVKSMSMKKVKFEPLNESKSESSVLEQNRSEKEDIPHSEPPVVVKKEKKYDLPLDCLVDVKNLESPLLVSSPFDVTNEKGSEIFGNEDRKDSILCNQKQFLKNSTASSSSISEDIQKQDIFGAVSKSDMSLKPINTKTEDSSVSSYDRAQNDRKRHLPFLSNGMHRPFKIPKLIKHSKVEDSALKTDLVLPEVSNKPSLNTNVLIKSENLMEINVSVEPILMNGNFQNDLKLENSCKKRTLPKHKKVNELHENPSKNNLNSRNSVLSVPNPSRLENNHETDQDKSEGAIGGSLGSKNLTSPTNSVALKSNHKHSDRKSHHCSTKTSSNAVSSKNSEHKHLLPVSGVEHGENDKADDKSSIQKVSEFKAPFKATEKVPSKQKLKEIIVDEIKKHLKDFYVTDLITKDEYKEIMRRSVPKVFQNCGNSIDSQKVRKLVVNYVHLIGNSKPDCS